MEKNIDVEFQTVTCRFGDYIAVDQVSFGISSGEFFSMLGPSGSGKTTCLRMVAGFQETSSGTILLEGKVMNGIPPYLRNVNTVFQDYALFPHLNVAENIGFGLMIRKESKTTIAKKVEEKLEMVRLSGLGKRKPSELSGGQRQRVALARALINEPKVLLLDEPLGALDLKLREEMQMELKSIQKQIGITFVFVTHDQEEALSMSDKIAVFNKGKVEQIGSPREVYEKPNSEFVANFVGISNLFCEEEAQAIIGKKGTYLVRPENVEIWRDSKPDGLIGTRAKFKQLIYTGGNTRLFFETNARTKIVALLREGSPKEFLLEEEVWLGWKPSSHHLISN